MCVRAWIYVGRYNFWRMWIENVLYTIVNTICIQFTLEGFSHMAKVGSKLKMVQLQNWWHCCCCLLAGQSWMRHDFRVEWKFRNDYISKKILWFADLWVLSVAEIAKRCIGGGDLLRLIVNKLCKINLLRSGISYCNYNKEWDYRMVKYRV